MSLVTPVILCGGSGTRLWPLSRSDRPKQFISLRGEHSLLEDTLLRAAMIVGVRDPICVTASSHATEVRNSLDRLGMRGQLLLEPCARGTAPAICAAALYAMRQDPEALLVVLPSDHVIDDDAAFSRSIASACEAALKSRIVVLGVAPRTAAEGFGYILRGASIEGVEHVSYVSQFIEKPSEQAARKLIQADAFWNAGIVVAQASVVVETLKRFAPDVIAAVEKSLEVVKGGDKKARLAAGPFSAAPNISFDKAVLEKSGDVVVIELAAMWRDVGTWDAVAELYDADSQGNRSRGQVGFFDSADTFVFGSSRPVIGLGLKDLVVVDTENALLIADRQKLGGLREVVTKLNYEGFADIGTVQQASSSAIHGADLKGTTRTIVLSSGQRELRPQLGGLYYWIVLAGVVEVTIDATTSSFQTHQSFFALQDQGVKIFNGASLPAKLLEVHLV